MPKQKINIGDIRPIYNITGFQVCKKTSDDDEKTEWIPVEKISEAEILSFIYKAGKKIEEEGEEDIKKEEDKEQQEKPKKKSKKKSKKKVTEEEMDIEDEDM